MARADEIVVVGSGPSMRRSGLGPQIDAFGTVIRFNRFAIEQYAADVGTRTDIWVTWALHGRALNGLRAVWQPIIGPVKLDRCTQELQRACDKAGVLFAVVPEDVVMATYNEMGLYFHGERKPTSGMVTLTYLLTTLGYGYVYACGFDHFAKNDPEHYYSGASQTPMNPRVDRRAEIAYYSKLVSQGRVRPLLQDGGEESAVSCR